MVLRDHLVSLGLVCILISLELVDQTPKLLSSNFMWLNVYHAEQNDFRF